MCHTENMKVKIQRTKEGGLTRLTGVAERKNRMDRGEAIFEEKMAEKFPE